MNIKLKQNDFIKTLKKKWLKKNIAILCMIIFIFPVFARFFVRDSKKAWLDHL